MTLEEYLAEPASATAQRATPLQVRPEPKAKKPAEDADPSEWAQYYAAMFVAWGRYYACGQEGSPCDNWLQAEEPNSGPIRNPSQTKVGYISGGKDVNAPRQLVAACSYRIRGTDCSGLVSTIAAQESVKAPNGVASQAVINNWVNAFPPQARVQLTEITNGKFHPGDLVIWNSEDNRHIGILEMEGKLISSLGSSSAKDCSKNLDAKRGPTVHSFQYLSKLAAAPHKYYRITPKATITEASCRKVSDTSKGSYQGPRYDIAISGSGQALQEGEVVSLTIQTASACYGCDGDAPRFTCSDGFMSAHNWTNTCTRVGTSQQADFRFSTSLNMNHLPQFAGKPTSATACASGGCTTRLFNCP